MNNNLSLGITFGLIAFLSQGFINFLASVPAKKLNLNKFILHRNIFNTIFLTIILFLTLKESAFSPLYMLEAFALSIVGYIPMYYFYKAASVGKMGVVAPVASTQTLIVTFLAFVLLGEHITGLQTIAIFLIVSGIILISIRFRDFKNSHIFDIKSGVPYAMIAALGWGIWTVLIKIPASHLGPFLTSLIVEAGAIIPAIFLLKKSGESLVLEDKKILKHLIPISALMVLWSIVYYQGIKIASVGIITALSSANPLIVAILCWIFYKEKLTIKQWLAIFLIVAGIMLVSI